MTELLELPELELSDDQLQTISGGCAGTTLGLGGLHFGFGGFHLGGGLHYSFGGFYGGPVVVSQPVALVPVQTQTVVAQPVTAVQSASCQYHLSG